MVLGFEPGGLLQLEKVTAFRWMLEAKSIGLADRLHKGEWTGGGSELILRFFIGATRMLTFYLPKG